VFALCGCHNDNELDPTAGTDGSDGTVADAGPVGDGTATVSWEAPTTTTNGAALTDLAGYRIYYGVSESDLAQSVQLDNVGVQTYVVENLGAGTWYFAVKAVTSSGVESSLSEIVSKTIG
jgi:Fibronectin type III domain